MFLEYRFNKAIEKLAAEARFPLRMKLWNGRNVTLAPNPTVTIEIPDASALRFFVAPDLNKLGEAFVDGHIRAEGSMHELFRVARELTRGVAARTSAGFRFLQPAQQGERSPGDPVPLRRLERILFAVPRPPDGVLVRLLPGRGRLARAGAGAEARPHTHQAHGAAGRVVPGHRLRLGRPDRARRAEIRRALPRHHSFREPVSSTCAN